LRKGVEISRVYMGMAPVGRPLKSRGGVCKAQFNNFATLMTSSTIADVTVGVNWSLSTAAPNYANFCAVFDQYKIERVEIWIEANVTTALTTYQEVCNYVSVVDLDDSGTPSSYLSLVDKPGAQLSKPWESHYHSFVPTLAIATYSGAFTSYMSMADQWVDTSSPSVQFYGLKCAVNTTTSVIGFQVRSRLTVSFRGVA